MEPNADTTATTYPSICPECGAELMDLYCEGDEYHPCGETCPDCEYGRYFD